MQALWLDLIPISDGYLVPVTVDGTPRYFLLDIGAPYSRIDDDVAKGLRLPFKPLPSSMEVRDDYGVFKFYIAVPTIALGNVPRQHMEMIVDPYHHHSDPRESGTLGMNTLSPFDIELDLGENKLGLFLPNHCPGPGVVYWLNNGIGAAPFESEETGNILLPMQLDGVKLEASVNTGNELSWMSVKAAHDLMGIDEAAADQIAVANSDMPSPMAPHPFKALVADGVTITNPKIHFYRTPESCDGVTGRSQHEGHNEHCFGAADIALGCAELRQLHMFFSFREEKVYFTAATPAPK